MFYSLTGTVLHIDETCVVIDCGGVGFCCTASLNTIQRAGAAGNKITLFTHLNVREDALDLFGFYDKSELDCFKLLISVTGVGPKAGISILSALTPEQISVCVASGDVKTITRAQGVGAKIAQRIVLELKGKMKLGDITAAVSGDSGTGQGFSFNADSNDAISALVMLGYSQSEAATAVSRLDKNLPTEELIKLALRNLM